jgi:hypothetical protein
VGTDAFNRADSLSLGAGWSEDEDDSFALQIKNNRVRMYGLLDAFAVKGLAIWSEELGDDQYAELTFEALLGEPEAGFAIRVPPTATRNSLSGYLVLYRRWGTPTLLLYKPSSYVLEYPSIDLTPLGSYAATLSGSDVVRLQAEGTAIAVLLNSTPVIEVTDSTHMSGRASLVSTFDMGDGPEIYMEWDNWSAGTLGEPPPLSVELELPYEASPIRFQSGLLLPYAAAARFSSPLVLPYGGQVTPPVWQSPLRRRSRVLPR